MRTKFLVSTHNTQPRPAYEALGKDPAAQLPKGPLPSHVPQAEWAPEGEPVIPNFPIWRESFFLSTISFKPVPYARVMEIDIDPDAAMQSLKNRYPGLPEHLLGTYVLATAKAALELPTGIVLRVSIEPDKTELFGVTESKTHVLWDKQPV